MERNAVLKPDPAPIVACTICRDVQNFDLLIDDMEAILGERWGDLEFHDAADFLDQTEANGLEFVAIAVDDQDEDELPLISELIITAKKKSIGVILIADELSPIALHHLLRLGADDFVPYPLPDHALFDAIEKLRAPPPPAPRPVKTTPAHPTGGNHDGIVLPVQGMAGGTGATTFAVNLAWEMATVSKKHSPSVCLLDLDFQTGSVATYLDLSRKEAVFEALTDTSKLDDEEFLLTLVPFNNKIKVLTAPYDMLPLDIIDSDGIAKLLDLARSNFDYVIVDMPGTIVEWSEAVLDKAQNYYAMIELDMRSAQNTQRFIRALKAEELAYEKLSYVLNRAPRFTDLSGKNRVKRMAQNLEITIGTKLPDGGPVVAQANDRGLPLAEMAAKNPLRKEIAKLAKSIHAQTVALAAAS